MLGVKHQHPFKLGRKAWARILKRVFNDITDNRLDLIAAGITFFIILSIFPLMIALVSVFGLIADQQFISDNLGRILFVIPSQAESLIKTELSEIIATSKSELSWGLVISVIGALWSAAKGARALISGMNVVYKEKEERSIIRIYITSLVFTFGIIILAIAVPFTISLLPLILDTFFPFLDQNLLLDVGRYILAIAALVFGLATLRRWGPSRRPARWQWISFGSLLTTAFWLFGSIALGFYFQQTSSLQAYGSLGSAIAFMLWLYLAAYITLLGSQLDAEIEHEVQVDTTVGKERPAGKRGAYVADTVAR